MNLPPSSANTDTMPSLASQNLAIDLVVQALPPAHDAIGEYTACLAEELAKKNPTRILTALDRVAPIASVKTINCFSLTGRQRFIPLVKELSKTNAAVVLLQYNPFAWGQRGWAPDLVAVLRQFHRQRPDVTLGVMFHETFMMNPGWKSWVMRQYQRRQFHQLADLADVSFFSTGVWAAAERRRRPAARVHHLPVGSNLPVRQADPAETRKKLGLALDDFVCGAFGGDHPSRMFPWIEQAVNQIATLAPSGRRVVLLHVGDRRTAWPTVRSPVIATGRLSAEEAADAIAVMDVMINPFIDGVSTRRGSAIAALQQGTPLLTTIGTATDPLWQKAAGQGIYLCSADEPAQWSSLVTEAGNQLFADPLPQRHAARQLHEQYFAWPKVASQLLEKLEEIPASASLSDRGTER